MASKEARYHPRIFLRFLTGVFPEVFEKKRVRTHVQKVPERAQKEGQRVPGDTERARES